MTPEDVAAIIEQHKYPTLHAGDTGLNVITLQIWLGMLGFYQGAITGLLDAATAQAVDGFRAQQRAAGIALLAPAGAVLDRDTWQVMDNLLQQRLPPDPDALDRLPLPRRSSYDSDDKYRKALYEGLRVFGFPVEPAAAPLRIPIAIDASGVGAVHGMPPGSYELQLDRVGKPTDGSAELHLEDSDGTPLQGYLRLLQGGVEHSVTVAGGRAQIGGLAPGDYEVVIDRADATTQILEDTGSVEIRLLDTRDKPLGGSGTLVGETGEAGSIEQTVKLFQALHRGLDVGLEADRSGLGASFLTGRFDKTTHHYNSRAWQSFTSTWGRFYGAPWMGIVFHPDATLQSTVPGGLHWGTCQTIRMLQQWGAAYLQASTDAPDLLDRLQRPIAVRYIARPLGGQIDGRTDFSQTGTQASLHLPRLSPRVVDGIATGPSYGGIDYRSSDYNSPQMERQLAVLVSRDPAFNALTPDEELVKRQLPPQLRPFVLNLTSDCFPASKLENTVAFFRDTVRFITSVFTTTTKDDFINTVRERGRPDLVDDLRTCDDRIFTWNELIKIRDKAELPDLNFSKMIWTHVQSVQKALWWCSLLVAAGKLDKAKEWSQRYREMGYGGLFKKYEDIEPANADALRFSFNDDDWQNLLQLESLVEFYINYNDPNRPLASLLPGESPEGSCEPRLPSPKDWRLDGSLYEASGVTGGLGSGMHFVLIDGFGARNNTQGKSVTSGAALEKLADNQFRVTLATSLAKKDDSDLSNNPANHVLWLKEDSKRASASYRITGATASGKTYTLTLEGTPSVADNTPWAILKGTAWLSGDLASSTENRVTLDTALKHINPNMDTIYLASDTARPSRVYRITDVKDASTLVVDGQPALTNNRSAWRIPAGIGGRHPPLKYVIADTPLRNVLEETDPHHVTGFDHYDGLLFLVYRGEIQDRFRFTSYTSRVRPRSLTNATILSSLSIRGNKSYDITSEPAGGNQYANFSFKVSSDQTRQRDGSRYYHARSVGTSDFVVAGRRYPPGATDDVFVHHGFDHASMTGSASCQVSPQFYALRDTILSLVRTQGQAGALLYTQFHGKDRFWSEGVYTAATSGLLGTVARNLLANLKAAWSGKLRGTLWLIRPDERPLADYSVLFAR